MYSRTTNDVTVTVRPNYLEEQSSPEESHYVWSYHITITNKGSERIQLRSRYWQITDNNGAVQEVRGEGIVGEQPLLAPGQTFEYTSGAPLRTPGGIMVGSYSVETAAGKSFDVAIPAFSLDTPFDKPQLN